MRAIDRYGPRLLRHRHSLQAESLEPNPFGQPFAGLASMPVLRRRCGGVKPIR
ncbi:hypothetical protein GLE_0846 [Lysobacter enzymogenes]|uniref:Uncharacterized protein n=1 Tax=Lysobacter enzymogenes TaxID=69 RepID=A0A0S2DCF4_LYSEN|nr:hypothetical protein GLE_0846 [Lysobacter enzymogenes]